MYVLCVHLRACARLPMCVLALRRPSFRMVYVRWDGHVHEAAFHLICTEYHIPFFRPPFSVQTARLSLSYQLRGTQGGRVYTRRKCWPRPGSVVGALGIQSRSIWQVIIAFRPAAPRTAMETPKMPLFLFRSAAVSATSPTPALEMRNGRSQGTTSAALQFLPL